MIYKLDTDFTKIEHAKGIMENKSIHSEIEVLVTDGVPEKDTGIELRPREKLPFALEDGKSLYARCSDLNHAGANLAVVNFNVPATGETGAGKSCFPIYTKSITFGTTFTAPEDGYIIAGAQAKALGSGLRLFINNVQVCEVYGARDGYTIPTAPVPCRKGDKVNIVSLEDGINLNGQFFYID